LQQAQTEQIILGLVSGSVEQEVQLQEGKLQGIYCKMLFNLVLMLESDQLYL